MVESKTTVETEAHTAFEGAKWPFYFVIYATIGFTQFLSLVTVYLLLYHPGFPASRLPGFQASRLLSF